MIKPFDKIQEIIQSNENDLTHKEKKNVTGEKTDKSFVQEEIQENSRVYLNNYNKENNQLQDSTKEMLKDGQASMFQLQKESKKKEANELSQKLKLLKKLSQKITLRMTLQSFLVMIILSSYFVIFYFLAMDSFITSEEVNKTQRSLMERGSCIQSALNYYRESINYLELYPLSIIDESINTQSSSDAIDAKLMQCQLYEQIYQQLRKSKPNYLSSSASIPNQIQEIENQDSSNQITGLEAIDNLESRDFCNYVYSAISYSSTNLVCQTALDGIFKQGFSTGLSFILSYLRKQNLGLSTLLKSRNLQGLKALLRESYLDQSVESLAFFLDQSFEFLSAAVRGSSWAFIQSLLRNQVIAFVCFVGVLTVGTVVLIMIGLNRLRQAMRNTNIVLKVIPIDRLNREEKDQVIQFFKQ